MFFLSIDSAGLSKILNLNVAYVESNSVRSWALDVTWVHAIGAQVHVYYIVKLFSLYKT